MTPLEDLVLVPRPRHLDGHGRGATVAGLLVRERVSRTVPREGFRLTSNEDGVQIEHRDAAGLRYAHQLLGQIRSQSAERLPGGVVEDGPDVAVRALMLDVSRDRVPTRPTLERLVEVAALARINQLQLYIEHTFAHPGHSVAWQGASPMTPAHLRWLDTHCAEVGIELVANQNCFGHMERWLRHGAYRTRAECPDGWEPMEGIRQPPSVLAPTPDNAAFALDLLDHQLECIRSRRVNIGCDETFELGRGASRADVEARGLGPVYLDHVRRLAGPLVERGYEVQIWADVLARHPELATTLPEGVTPVAWCYEAPPSDDRPLDVPDGVARILAAFGVDLATFSGFGPATAPLAEAGIPFWVAPGTSSWNSLVGRIDNARANLLDAAETARAHGCEGILITDWGDNGHHQPPSVSFGPIVYGGAVAWGLDANRDLDLGAVLDHHVFADPTGFTSDALDVLGHQWARTGQRSVNASPLAAGLFPDQAHLVLGAPDQERVRGVVADIQAARASLARAAPACRDGDLVLHELDQAAGMARHGAWRLLGDAGPPAAEQAQDLALLLEGHCVAWLARSRPGGLSDSLAHLDAAMRALPTGT